MINGFHVFATRPVVLPQGTEMYPDLGRAIVQFLEESLESKDPCESILNAHIAKITFDDEDGHDIDDIVSISLPKDISVSQDDTDICVPLSQIVFQFPKHLRELVSVKTKGLLTDWKIKYNFENEITEDDLLSNLTKIALDDLDKLAEANPTAYTQACRVALENTIILGSRLKLELNRTTNKLYKATSLLADSAEIMDELRIGEMKDKVFEIEDFITDPSVD